MRPTTLRVSHSDLGTLVPPGRRFEERAAETLRLVEVSRSVVGPPEAHLVLPFAVEPLDGRGWLAVPSGMAFRRLDRALGGPAGRHQPRRSLSTLEAGLCHALMLPLLEAWGKAWGDRARFVPRDDMPGRDAWVRWTWSVLAEDDDDDALHAAVDERTAAALAAATPAGPTSADWREAVGAAAVTPTLTAGSARLRMGDLAELRPGALVVLDARVDDPWTVRTAGRTLAHGRPVRREGRAALLVTGLQEQKEERERR